MTQVEGPLICDAGLPICGGGTLREELLLYDLRQNSIPELVRRFASATGKELTLDSDVSILSGGQKVILLCLCALYSPAVNIRFINLWHSLDPANREWVKDLISSLQNGRRIDYIEEGHADLQR